ncbi:hypothetical protein ACJIZ3_023557 [Penstemon smallii]|uniref:Uncharacterized protein n=1 Tax=Penstemon smallii TaxID=265156 RepID=A0ABD3TQT0_9LAMI
MARTSVGTTSDGWAFSGRGLWAGQYIPAGGSDGTPSCLQATCAVPQDQCGIQCERRCSATSHKKPCLFFCNKCCNKCLCVPPGTYGNKECCSCYNNWKTKEGGPKCP